VFFEWTFDPVHTVAVSFRHLTYSLVVTGSRRSKSS
jgi:hypothetical protein